VALPEEDTVISAYTKGGAVLPGGSKDFVRTVAPGSSQGQQSSGDGERAGGSGSSRQSDASAEGASGGRQLLVDYLADNLHVRFIATLVLFGCGTLLKDSPFAALDPGPDVRRGAAFGLPSSAASATRSQRGY